MHAKIKSRRALPFGLSVLLTACFASHVLSEPSAGWALPGGGQGGGHFSTATQITPDNVSDLTIAWVHRSGDYSEGDNFIDGLSGTKPLQSSWQATPILIEDQLVICTPFNRIIAVDASTGEERWSFTPDIDVASFGMPRCRGVTQWQDPRTTEGEMCHTVVIAPLMDARIVGLDAITG